MFSQYFGNYLLNKNFITAKQLKDAMDYQKSIHIKLGVLAINMGYMNSSQVQEVHELQSKVDKRFGEIAVEKGYLSESNLQKLLSCQKQGHLQLSQALIDRAYLSLSQLEEALENYKNDCRLTDQEINLLKQGEIDQIVHVFLKFENSTLKKIYGDYISLMLKNIIRLIDENPRLEKNLDLNTYSTEWIVSQEISGNPNIFTGIAANKDIFLALASQYGCEQFTTINEMAQACVAEFLNVHNGIFLVNMSNQGIELEMQPQVIQNQITLTNITGTYIIPIYLFNGKIDLILAAQKPTMLSV
jgi:hypothetical protein